MRGVAVILLGIVLSVPVAQADVLSAIVLLTAFAAAGIVFIWVDLS
jgi:hypothetical protein